MKRIACIFLLMFAFVLPGISQSPNGPNQPSASKALDSAVWSPSGTLQSGSTAAFLDGSLGTGSNNFEVLVNNPPATLSVTITPYMRGGTPITANQVTYTTAASTVLSVSGPADRYLVLVSWTGGTSSTNIVLNRTAITGKNVVGAVHGVLVANNCVKAFSPTQVQDSGAPCGSGTGNVSGAASSIASNVPIFSDTTGKALADSGGPMPATLAPIATQFVSGYTKGTGVFTQRVLVSADVPNNAANTSGSSASFTGNLVGDVTGTQGATSVGRINGTAFAGTVGNLTSYGAANTPADAGFLATNVTRKDAANTAGAAMTLNMSGSTVANAFRMPVSAGCVTSAPGGLCFDSTAGNVHQQTNGADSISVSEAAALTINTLPKATDSTHGLQSASLFVDNGTTGTYGGSGGFGVSGSGAGGYAVTQGQIPNIPANSIVVDGAPASVTASYFGYWPGAQPALGFVLATPSSAGTFSALATSAGGVTLGTFSALTGGTYAQTPPCSISGGGGGTGALCSFTMSGTAIASITVSTGGTGYSGTATANALPEVAFTTGFETLDQVGSPVAAKTFVVGNANFITLGDNTSTATGANDLFSFTDGLNNTGNGAVLRARSANGSNAFPFAATAQGVANGVALTPGGVFHAIGTGHVSADQLNGTTPGGTCTNQVVTAISSSGVPTCTTVTLDLIGSPAASQSFTDGNFTLSFTSAQTTNTQSAINFGEATAATGGSGNNEVAIQTLANSTSTPLKITQGAISTVFPTAALVISQGANTGATNVPIAQFSGTWNNASIAGPAFSVAVTNTASTATALLFQLLAGAGGATTEYQVDKGGSSQQQGNLRGISTSVIGFNSGGINTAIATNINEIAAGYMGVGTTAANSNGFVKTAQTIAVTTADVTCGTGGTISSCVAMQTITGLSLSLPVVAANWDFECDLVVSQATATAADQIGVQTATNGATNLTAAAQAFTATGVAPTTGAITDVASTTTAQSVITLTPGATGTKVPIHLAGSIEGTSASAGGTVLNITVLTGAAADLLTIYRGSKCWVH